MAKSTNRERSQLTRRLEGLGTRDPDKSHQPPARKCYRSALWVLGLPGLGILWQAQMQRKTTAVDLGIDLASKKEEALFQWFLACLLFGRPIRTNIAEQAYQRLIAAHLTSPDAILKTGWDELVRLLDEAYYVCYDFSTATRLFEISEELTSCYGTAPEG